MEPFSEGGPADARRPTARDAARFEWFWCELSLIGQRWSVLHHPFLVRCLAGELTWGQLQLFAEEFDHLVTASARTDHVTLVLRRRAVRPDGRVRPALGARHQDAGSEHRHAVRDRMQPTPVRADAGRCPAPAHDHVALLRQAEAVQRGFWEMLDALEERGAAVS